MPRIPLTIQGLILVSIPLCFEILFVCILWNLQREADVETANALKAHEISDCINKLTTNTYELWDSFHDPNGPLWVANNFRRKEYRKFLYSLEQEYLRFDSLTQDQPELNAIAKNCESALKQGTDVLDRIASDVHSHKQLDFEAYRPAIDTLRNLFQTLITGVLSLVSLHEKQFAEQDNSVQIEHRNLILKYAIAAVWVNGVFSVILAIFLVKGVTSKLQIMSDNARRISLAEPLNPPIKGNDEIAELDRAFHWMDESLKETARARQEMFAMVTHDLRSPLTVVQASLEMVDMKTSEEFGNFTASGERLIRTMARNCNLMMGLINDLLDIEKINSGSFVLETESVCLAEVFEEVRGLMSDWIETHKLKLIVDDTELFAVADQSLLTRVVYNLVSNAAKYSPSGGVITIAAVDRGSEVEVTVSDTGRGIPPHMLETIFDRFKQVDDGGRKKKGSSGLGLTICKAVIDLHEGRIWATSKVGEGSVFHFTLAKA
jgi:signal transduction histidine kinase